MNMSYVVRRQRTALWILIVLGFLLRVGVASRAGLNVPPPPGSDQLEYDRYAWNLAQGLGYRGPSPDVADPNHLTAYRTPGVPLVWATLYSVFGHRYDVIRVFHCALGALVIPLLFALARRCFNERIAWMAAGVWTVFPTSLLYSGELLSEPLLTVLFTCATYETVMFGFDRRWARAIRSGLLWGFVVLVHPSKVFMLPLLAVWGIWQFWSDRPSIIRALAVPAIAGLTLVPWTVRNYVVFHEFIPLSTGGQSVLLQSNNSIVVEDPKYFGYSIWDTQIPEYRAALQAPNNEIQRDRLAGRFALEWLKDHPQHWWFLAQAKFRRGWSPFLQPHTPWVYRIGMLLSWGPVLVLFAIAFFPTLVAFVRSRHPGWVMHLGILEFTMVIVIFFGFSRYRYSIEPLCIILAAVSVDFALRRVRAYL